MVTNTGVEDTDKSVAYILPGENSTVTFSELFDRS